MASNPSTPGIVIEFTLLYIYGKNPNGKDAKGKIESVIKRMRWKAHFYLKENTSNIAYTNYGFKTRNHNAQCKELQNFEKDLLDTIKLIKFWIVKYNFQRKLKEDILNIKSSSNVYAFSDKTSNIYRLSPQDYK